MVSPEGFNLVCLGRTHLLPTFFKTIAFLVSKSTLTFIQVRSCVLESNIFSVLHEFLPLAKIEVTKEARKLVTVV